jgi:hypothetical protein
MSQSSNLNVTNPSLTSTPTKSQNSTLNEDDSVYILPKTYNGKTVTELFPEFQYDSVLRFSKLFGVGRSTSLPRIWRGTRKRKKKNSETDRSLSNDYVNDTDTLSTHTTKTNTIAAAGSSLHTIPEEDNSSSQNKNELVDDVFKLFDEGFTSKNEDSNKTEATTKVDATENPTPTEFQAEKVAVQVKHDANDVLSACAGVETSSSSKKTDQSDEDKLEFEQGDQVSRCLNV